MNLLQPVQQIFRARNGLCVRLTRSSREVAIAQALRFRVFYEELNAVADSLATELKLDADRFDAFCDHLVVVKQSGDNIDERFRVDDGEMVGTYRLLRQDVALENGGFYTQSEFDLNPLLARKPELNFLELGRSCVLKPYRTKPVVELLWQGIWDYVRNYRVDVMMGCASLEGANPLEHRDILNFLARTSAAPADWNVRALPERYVEMKSDAPLLDARAALKILPPLMKGYLRLGCYMGEGAVADFQFNTTDVLIILPVARINPRYFAHFGQPND